MREGPREPGAPAHVPRKRFGQHFLHEVGFIDRIVRAVDPKPGELLVEVGPGEGALTFPLLASIEQLTVVELDRDLIPLLRERAPAEVLRIVEADVLKVDFRALRDALAHDAGLAPGTPLRIVGNLPYNISTPILFHLLGQADAIRDMHFMLQREVVERMGAPHGSKVYGRLSVMLQARCRVEPLFRVPAGAFRPPPKVESAVVRLTPRAGGDIGIDDDAIFERVVRDAFSKRRKTLRNALADIATAARIEAGGVDPGARAEEIPVAQFVALANSLATDAAA
ncbi:MAG TPA: 16S rRNA (adenine(1518)-N(6)/adenine(1519)-N(6))-dimethyltransferase RsmA [Candidatus Saccharimonadia bacterium]|nr:16S rRNA (adenine(1518)-N(6)/adenine(1519)-N(6))-dimethyltransferase RsmA [Candidatus Saccharimonadia bacterium]